jgi:cytochrome c-type biogenesis protein CcmH
MKAARSFPWLLLAVFIVGVLAWAVWPTGGSRSVSERARDLATELRCPVCEALSVADSPSSTARAIRADLRRRIAAGQSDEQIRQAYVERYGESILLEPQGSGLGMLVWGLPVVALVLGGGGLALALRRWRREPRLHATSADEALVARARGTERA